MTLDYILYAPYIILFLTLAVQIIDRARLVKHASYFFWGSVAIIFALLAYKSGEQYFGWLTAPLPARALLPPYAPITYFLFYVGVRFWLPYLLSLAFAGIAFLTAKYLNKKYQERFFYPEEQWLIALGFFLCIHPFWIVFLMLTLLLYVLYAALTTIISRQPARVSFYYFWLPAAIVTTALLPALQTLPFLTVLKV